MAHLSRPWICSKKHSAGEQGSCGCGQALRKPDLNVPGSACIVVPPVVEDHLLHRDLGPITKVQGHPGGGLQAWVAHFCIWISDSVDALLGACISIGAWGQVGAKRLKLSRCAGRIVAAVVRSVKVLSNTVVGSTLEETRTTWVTVTITLTQLKWKSTIGSVITCAGIQSKNLLHILDCHSSCHPRHKVSWQAAWEGWNLKDIRHLVNWPWCQI